MVWAEANFITERTNRELASQTALLQMVLSATPNTAVKATSTRKAARELNRRVQQLAGSKGLSE